MRIAYVIPTQVPTTFIYNEMIEVQEAGHDLVVAPLYSTPPSKVPVRVFDRLKPGKILPASLCTPTILWRSLFMLLTHPVKVLCTLCSLHRSAGLNPFSHAAILAVVPKALATAWWLTQLQVDRIHAHFASHTATCAAIASALSGIPFSFTAHAYDIYCTTMMLRNDTLDWKLRHAIQVFAISEHGANLLRKRLAVGDRGRVHRVYVGIPMDLFKEQSPLPLTNGELRLLCIARLENKKGIDTLLDACGLLKARSIPFHLSIYGAGELRGVLMDQIMRLGLDCHVQLENPIPQEKVATELAACHAFVMPCREDQTTGNIDGIPTVFMEAMATGRPVISCPVAGVPELVRDGETGLLVPQDNPAALAEAIIRLGSDDSLRTRLGRQARLLAQQQHNQHTNTGQFLCLLTSGNSNPC